MSFTKLAAVQCLQGPRGWSSLTFDLIVSRWVGTLSKVGWNHITSYSCFL